MDLTRDFVATVFIVYKNKLLLHFHQKLKSWLPVGGHVEKNELPQEAAIRETKEESGLEIKLINYEKLYKDYEWLLIPPVHLLLEDIEPLHQHIDFIFFAKVNNPKLDSKLVKLNKLKWFSLGELEELEAYENVKVLGNEALKLLGEK